MRGGLRRRQLAAGAGDGGCGCDEAWRSGTGYIRPPIAGSGGVAVGGGGDGTGGGVFHDPVVDRGNRDVQAGRAPAVRGAARRRGVVPASGRAARRRRGRGRRRREASGCGRAEDSWDESQPPFGGGVLTSVGVQALRGRYGVVWVGDSPPPPPLPCLISTAVVRARGRRGEGSKGV